MPRRRFQLTAVVAVFCWTSAHGQSAQAPQRFGVCGSQANLPTIYFSGVLQGPAAAFAGFRLGFAEFLEQHYAYKGAVACLPANNAVIAQNFINTRAAALRNGKRAVIETGWTETAAPLAAGTGMAAATKQSVIPPAASAPANGASAAGAASVGGSTGGATQLTSILGAVFGTGSGGSAGTGASAAKAGSSGAAGAAAAPGGAATSGAPAANAGSASGQSALLQVSNSLASVFGNKSANAGASGQGAPKSPQPNASDSGLGGAQWQATKLVVYGCGRQDMQIACVSDLTNQNQKDTLVQAADVWKDAFIVDDRGDRHPRSTGFFLNVDGDQRPQLDISYGKSARFVLLFDGVQTKVQKVALRSATGGLDVEEIGLIVPGAAAQASHPQ